VSSAVNNLEFLLAFILYSDHVRNARQDKLKYRQPENKIRHLLQDHVVLFLGKDIGKNKKQYSAYNITPGIKK